MSIFLMNEPHEEGQVNVNPDTKEYCRNYDTVCHPRKTHVCTSLKNMVLFVTGSILR